MGWLNWLLGRGKEMDTPVVQEAMARAVDKVEPRLRQFPGYPGRYRKAVVKALGYAKSLAAQVPGPVTISRETYVSDPLVHALFATPDDVHAALCVSRAMHDFRRDNPDAGEVYALIGMRRGSKSMLGMEMVGEVLRRDVPQLAVYFTDHTLADAGCTEAEARARIAEGFFDSLVGHVLRRIETRKQSKAGLENRRDEILGALHQAAPDRRQELESELNSLLDQLGKLSESLALSRYADDFDAVLLEPDRYVYLERTVLSLDGMGFLRQSEFDGGREIEFCDVIGRDRRRWTIALMYCNRVKEEASLGDRLVVAERWLGL